jgi:DNA-binding transcriptional LysR family regulator
MLDVRRLHVLSAVVEAGSITAAAAVLGYTPSAVSQSVAALERDAGVALLEKAGRGIRPTQAGRLLAEHARAIASQLREAEAALAALRAGQRGRLRLAAFATAGANLVPQALALFRAAYPAVEMDLAVADTDEALARLRAGQIDVAIIAEHGVPESTSDRGLVHTRLLDDCYRAVLPRGHRLAARRRVGLGELSDDPWIVTASPRCDSRDVIIAACARAGFTPRFAIEADEFTTTVGFVGAGLGVALVPLIALGSVPDSVRVRPVRGPAPIRYVYAVSRRQAGEQVAVRGMLAALTESARSAFPAEPTRPPAVAAAG